MEDSKKPVVASKVSRHNLVQNSRDKFYSNLNQVYIDNKNAPVLEAAPSTKKPIPAKPQTGTFGRAGAQIAKQPAAASRTQRPTPSTGGPQSQSLSSLRQRTSSRTNLATSKSKSGVHDAPQPPASATRPRGLSTQNYQQRSGSAAGAKKPPAKPVGSFGSSVRDRQQDALIKQKNAAPKKNLAGTMPAPARPPKPEKHVPSIREVHQMKQDALARTVEAQIQARIDKNRAFINTLLAMESPPPYAHSLLQSARFNKTKVLEAHLTLMAGQERVETVNKAESKSGRTALMFASYYGNVDSVEFLAASDAVAQLVDKKGRSCMHYAAMNDSAQLIETIFLHAKANPTPMKAATDFAPEQAEAELDENNLGTVDEKYHDMEQQMDLIDSLFLDKSEAVEQLPTTKQVMKGLMNYRDLKGRTALHMAIAFNNKVAAETMLHLGANPHVKDAFGQRPIDNCYVESLRSLLEIKMASVQPPGAMLLDNEEETKSQRSGVSGQLRKMPSQMNKSLLGSQAQTAGDKMYPLEPKDIKQIPKEKVISARIGAESDTYIMYAIKAKRHDVLKFLLREVPEIDLLAKNSQGMTAVHLAIRSNTPSMVKMLFLRNHKNTSQVDQVIQNTKIDDIKGNLSQKVVKMLSVQNLKGMSPLISSVDHGNYELFRFIIDLMIHIQKTQVNQPVLTRVIDLKDEKQETAMIKAVRMGRLQMAYTFLHMIGPSELLGYSSVTQTDATGKNVLHHAVITKNKELVQRFVLIDSDKKTLRNTRDARGKTPQALDEQSQFSEMFVTVWDCCASGATVKLQQVLEQMTYRGGVAPKDQQTYWFGNTPLIVAVKNQQLEIVKQLIQTYKANLELKNKSNRTALDIAKRTIKDPNVLETVTKLLHKQTSSTRVIHNKEILEERKQYQQGKANLLKDLRDALKAKLQEKEIDIQETFRRFDSNGDGVFSHMEFEMIFTVLDIAFTKDQLRKLISMTDKNRDGKIDAQEFHRMLYAEEFAAQQSASANHDEDEDIEVVDELSNESDDDDEGVVDREEEKREPVTSSSSAPQAVDKPKQTVAFEKPQSQDKPQPKSQGFTDSTKPISAQTQSVERKAQVVGTAEPTKEEVEEDESIEDDFELDQDDEDV